MIKRRKKNLRERTQRYFRRIKITIPHMSLDHWIIVGLIISLPGAKFITSLLNFLGLISNAKGVAEGIIATLICGAAIFALVHPKRRAAMAEHPAFFVTLVLLPLMLIPAILSGNNTGLLYGGVMWMILVISIYASSVMNRRFFASILDLMLLLSVIASVWGVLDYFINQPKVWGEVRTSSIFDNANYYGYAIELFSIIALCRFVRRTKVIYLIVLAINLSSILLCGCRAAWVSVFVSAITLVIFKLRGKRLWLGITVAALLSALMLIIVLPEISQRFTGEAIYGAFSRRIAMFRDAIHWIKSSPIIGYGTGSYHMLSIRDGVMHSRQYLQHAHNLFLNITLDFGFVGFAAFILYVWQIITPVFTKGFIHRYSYISAILLTALVATAVHGMIDVPIYGVSTGLLIALISSGSAILRNETAWAQKRAVEKEDNVVEI